MLRKVMIALAATAFVGAMAVSSTADAQGQNPGGMRGFGGGFRGGFGGGFRGGFGGGYRGGFVGHRGGFGGGGFRGAHFGGIRTAGFKPVVGVHRGFHPGFHRAGFGPRHFGHFRFRHHRRFFAAAPIFIGASFYPSYAYSSYYDDPCWVVQYTPWGPRAVYVCGYY